MSESFKRYSSNDTQLSLDSMNRLAAAVERLMKASGSVGSFQFQGPSAKCSAPAAGQYFLIQVTAVDQNQACKPAYSWQQVVRDACGFIQPGEKFASTFDVFPAYPVSGNPAVPLNTGAYFAWVSRDQKAVEFLDVLPYTCQQVVTAVDLNACTVTTKYIRGNFTVSDTPC